MGNVVIVRPGCTDFDEQHRIQGGLDLPLSPRGEEQVQRIVEQLRTIPLDVIYTSTCEPARSTAQALGEALNVPVKEKEGFRNLRQGLWEGLQVEELRRKFPKVFRQWQDSPETICPPGGEPVTEAIERIQEALAKPIRKRQQFAVVASEPLATLVCCLLRQCRPETPDFDDVCDDAGRVDIIDLDCRGETVTVFPAKPTAAIETSEGCSGGINGKRAHDSEAECEPNGTSPVDGSCGGHLNGKSEGCHMTSEMSGGDVSSRNQMNGSTHRLAGEAGGMESAMASVTLPSSRESGL